MTAKTTTLKKIHNLIPPVAYIAEKRQQWIKKFFNYFAPKEFLVFKNQLFTFLNTYACIYTYTKTHLTQNIFNLLVYPLCEFPRKEMSKEYNTDYQELFVTSVPHHLWLRTTPAICTALTHSGAMHGSSLSAG